MGIRYNFLKTMRQLGELNSGWILDTKKLSYILGVKIVFLGMKK